MLMNAIITYPYYIDQDMADTLVTGTIYCVQLLEMLL
jgi:hypothetical protein